MKRDRLLKQIRSDLVLQPGLSEQGVHLAGLLVLYNNMRQGLFHSQIWTIGATLAVLTLMLFVLFRSLKIALILLP